jgi:hypothetical protein
MSSLSFWLLPEQAATDRTHRTADQNRHDTIAPEPPIPTEPNSTDYRARFAAKTARYSQSRVCLEYCSRTTRRAERVAHVFSSVRDPVFRDRTTLVLPALVATPTRSSVGLHVNDSALLLSLISRVLRTGPCAYASAVRMEIRLDQVIAAPPERVFRFFSDPRQRPRGSAV